MARLSSSVADDMIIRTIVFVLMTLFIAALAQTTFGKPWKGIHPLKTTRSEVIGILGSIKETDELSRAVFWTNDGIVRVSWTRPDCVTEEFLLKEAEADDNALVFQITLEPISPLQSIEGLREPESASVGTKTDLKSVYKKWLAQDVSCLLSGGESSCSITSSQTGFGFSSRSGTGITALYYFASTSETETFLKTLAPCKP